MNIEDHDIEVLKALWRSRNPDDLCDNEIRVALENVIDILTKIQRCINLSNIYLELTAFEAGVLTATLFKAVDEGADLIVNDIYNRLITVVNDKYYEE